MATTYQRVLFIPLLLCFSLYAHAQTITGRVTDSTNPVEFCNVLIQNTADTTYIKGAVSGADGRFTIHAKDGNYKLKVSLLGYGAVEKTITVKGNTDLGELVIKPSEEQLDEVVIRANLVDALADRYVMNNLGKQPIAAGKSTLEVLKYAPGVWVQNGGISINGQEGSKILINDRLVRLTGVQLTDYLNSLKAENIRKIEIIPDPTAEYDADSSGGIISITLDHSAYQGLDGTVGIRYYQSDYPEYTPNLSLSFNHNKWNMDLMYIFSPSMMYYRQEQYQNFYNEQIINHVSSATRVKNPNTHFLNLGFSYDINKNRYFALAVGATYQDLTSVISSDRLILSPAENTRALSQGNNDGYIKDIQVSTNYVDRIKPGDELKIRADVFLRAISATDRNVTDYYRMAGDVWENDPFDQNAYLQNYPQNSNVYTASSDYKHTFGDKSFITAGVKFTYLDVNTYKLFEVPFGNTWVSDENRSDDFDYNENISALYVKYDMQGKKWAYTFSARVEYYGTNGISNTLDQTIRQRILGLFPYVNIRYFVNRDKGTSLGFNIGRSIARRDFSELNPNVIQTSDFSKRYGNAYLDPSYVNKAGISATVRYKYNFSLNYALTDNQYETATVPNPDEPNGTITSPEKIRYHHSLSLNAYVPVSPAKWLNLMTNLGGGYVWYNLLDEKRSSLYGRAMLSAEFVLPHDWDIELSWRAFSSMVAGNTKRHAAQSADLFISKKLLKNRNLTISGGINDLFNSANGGRDYVTSPGLYSYNKRYSQSRSFNIGISYRFNYGRKASGKYIEKEYEDKYRVM